MSRRKNKRRNAWRFVQREQFGIMFTIRSTDRKGRETVSYRFATQHECDAYRATQEPFHDD